MPSSPQKTRPRRTSSTSSASSALRRGASWSSTPAHRKASTTRSSPNSEALLLSTREDDLFGPDSCHAADEFERFQDETNGLGNLAEELADAWDDDGEHAPRPTHCGGRVDSAATPQASTSGRPGHEGDSSDSQDVNLFSATLETEIAAVNNLVRQESATDGTEYKDIICRVADALREMPSQSKMENGTSRLIATHAALTAHLSNQARALQALSHPLISPLAVSPEPEVVDDILPLLAALILAVPIQRAPCLLSLHSLRASTTDLQAFLNYLTDTIYMTRQTITSATRRLRLATDIVSDLRREAEAREEAVDWIEKGAWDTRLSARECQKVCGDVIGGFEEVCQNWRTRLMDGLVTA